MITLGLIDANDQEIEATLDGITYYVNLSWNQTAARWTMSIKDADKLGILSCVPLIPYWPLTSLFRDRYTPVGELFVETVDNLEVIDRESFIDGKAQLVYYSKSELQDAGLWDKLARI